MTPKVHLFDSRARPEDHSNPHWATRLKNRAVPICGNNPPAERVTSDITKVTCEPCKAMHRKSRCDFTRGIVLAAAEMARYEGTASVHVRTLISAAGGERAVVEHGDAEDLAELRTVGAIAP